MRNVGRYIGRHYWGMLAMFIALGGTAYAATQLPANSVGTKQIQSNENEQPGRWPGPPK